jgi:hypothetical protein
MTITTVKVAELTEHEQWGSDHVLTKVHASCEYNSCC